MNVIILGVAFGLGVVVGIYIENHTNKRL